MIDAFAIRPGTAPRVKPKFKGPGSTSPSAYRKPQWNAILQRFGHAGVTPPAAKRTHADQAAAIQRAIDAARHAMDDPTYSLDFDDAPTIEHAQLEFADLAAALLPENADDQNTPRELIESPPELIESGGRVHAAQLAMTHARAQAAALNDDTFVKADQLFKYDAEGRSACRGMLLRMARGTARIAEAQAALEGEMASFVEMRKRYCDPWRERCQLLENEITRHQRAAESARRELRLALERTREETLRGEVERRRLSEALESAKRATRLEVDAVTRTLTPEYAQIESQWRAEVEAVEERAVAARVAHEEALEEGRLAHAAEVAAMRRAHQAEVAAMAEAHQWQLEAQLEDFASTIEQLREAREALPPLEAEVTRVLEEKALLEEAHRKQAEEMQIRWEHKEVECEALRVEMARLQALHAECLAAGSLEALRRKQIGFAPPPATALVGKARTMIYEEALKQPASPTGLAKPEAVSWRGTAHDYQQLAKDFHASEWQRAEPPYGPRHPPAHPPAHRKPPASPRPPSVYEEARRLHGRQPEPPRPWPHNQLKQSAPKPGAAFFLTEMHSEGGG